MKFSVIIPALNEEKFIASCIKSIKNQLVNSDEIIVVDNGSVDKTSEIAKKLGCKVVKEKKRGISHARNKGAKVAKGDVLCFIDADGVVSRDWLKIAKKTLSKEDVQAVDGLIIFSHQGLLKRIWYNVYLVFAYFGIVLSGLLFSRHFFVGNNTVIRKEVFWKLGGWDPVVDEQLWLSKKFWKLPNHKGVFNPRMIIYYSSRGFDSGGYLRTIIYWIKGALTEITQDGYHYSSRKDILARPKNQPK